MEQKKPTIREVTELPEVAILDELILNKTDGCFYLGVEDGKKTKKGVRKHGSNLEKTGV